MVVMLAIFPLWVWGLLFFVSEKKDLSKHKTKTTESQKG